MSADAVPWVSTTGGLFLLALAVAAVAFLAASEAALLSANRLRLRHRAERGEIGAATALRVIAQHDRFFATILTTENLCIIAASSLGTALAIRLFGASGVLYATAAMGAAIIVLGEITPKTVAAAHADAVAPVVAPVVALIMRVLRPIVWLLGVLPRGVLRLAPLGTRAGAALTGEELRTMVGLSRASGGISAVESELLGRILELRRITARDLMTPRTELTAVSVRATTAKIVATARSAPNTRLVVYGRDFDDLVGFVQVRDLVGLCAHARGPKLADLLHPLPKVPGSLRGAELLRAFRENRAPIAAVLDEFGGTAGVVTFNEAIEQVVGALEDRGVDDDAVVADAEGWTIGGRAPLPRVNEALGLSLPADRNASLAGFLLAELGRIPHGGETVEAQGVLFTVEELEGRRIAVVRARRSRKIAT